MFPEASTWSAEVVRVTDDGRRVPIAEPWSGYRWDELVEGRGLSVLVACATTPTPAWTTSWRSSTPPSTGSPSNTPRDTETRYLEAVVTAWHNTDEPEVVVLRSDDRSGAGMNDRRAARPAGEHAGDGAAAGADRPVVLLHLRPFLDDAWDGRIYRDDVPRALRVVVPGAAAAAVRRACCASGRSPPSR